MTAAMVDQAIPSDLRGRGTSATGYDAVRLSERSGAGEQGARALEQALDRARHWVRRAQGGVFLAMPFPGVRALWVLPATLLWGGIGGVMAMLVVAVTLFALRHGLEDARWAFFGGGERQED